MVTSGQVTGAARPYPRRAAHRAGAAPVQSFLFGHSRGQIVYDCPRSR
ncbi:hypothetical protein [Actinomadura atramentaria]|nr:hypothetical protein [Actinomadura atramentaria]